MWEGVYNKHPVKFKFINGFVLNVGEMVALLWFEDILLEFALSLSGGIQLGK